MSARHQLSAEFKKTPNGWRFFSIGFWLLMISWSVLGLSKTRWQIDSIYISAPLLCIGMILLLVASLQDLRSRLKGMSPIILIIFIYLILWSLVVAFRGFSSLELKAIRDMWGINFFAWTWFVPFFMLLSMDTLFLQQLLKVMTKQGVLGLSILAIGWIPPIRLYTFFNLGWGCSALLLFWHYLSKEGRIIALIGSFLTIWFAVLSSERNAIVGHGFLMIAASFIGMMRRYRFRGRRRVAIITCFLIFSGLFYYGAQTENYAILSEKTEQRISKFKEELFVNTRSGDLGGTGISLYRDFLNDMNIWDLLFGRGSIGTYQSVVSGGKSRPIIESGYFQIILKGGILLLLLTLMLAVPAAWKGLFSSRNWVVKGFAIVVVGWLLEMVPYGVPSAFPRYALFWFSIGICLNPVLRSMTDEEIESNVLPEESVSFRKKPNSSRGALMPLYRYRSDRVKMRK